MAYVLPPLPYPFNALEPNIDAQTMEIHHDKHHNTYVTNLNNAIAGNADLEAMSAIDLIQNLDKVPEDKRTAVRLSSGTLSRFLIRSMAFIASRSALPALALLRLVT